MQAFSLFQLNGFIAMKRLSKVRTEEVNNKVDANEGKKSRLERNLRFSHK